MIIHIDDDGRCARIRDDDGHELDVTQLTFSHNISEGTPSTATIEVLFSSLKATTEADVVAITDGGKRYRLVPIEQEP